MAGKQVKRIDCPFAVLVGTQRSRWRSDGFLNEIPVRRMER
jgi:hypothetical protein